MTRRAASAANRRAPFTYVHIMLSHPQDRRDFIETLALLGGAAAVLPSQRAPVAATAPFVLGPGEGEHLVHFRDGGDVCIKLSSATVGSEAMAVGTQQVKVGTGIPEHRHPATDETFLVVDGTGIALLDGAPHDITAGAWIYIPRGTWHAFTNPDAELRLLWTVSPAGLDAFFRATCSKPGESPKGLSKEEIRRIALAHGTEFR